MKHLLISTLDHSYLRPILAQAATFYLQRFSPTVEIKHDGEFWLHKEKDYWIADGSKFEYSKNVIDRDLIGQYFSDVADFWFFAYKPQPGDVIVDVGAGRGEDLLPMADAVGPTGKVIAIEAHPTSFKYLASIAKHNQLSNARPIHAAVMDCAGEVKIDDTDDWVCNKISESGTFEIPGRTLDEICADVPKIDLLKMNIEGAERLAIRGAEKTMKRVRNVCISCHDFLHARGHKGDFQTRTEITDYLKKNGFSIKNREDDPRDFVRDYVYGSR